MNKLGFYVESTTIPGLAEAIRDVRPPTLLIHAGDRGLLQEIRRSLSPDTFVIGRMFIEQNEQQSWLDGSDPEGRGRAFADRILGFDFGFAHERGANGRLLIDAWMSLNECLPGPASDAYLKATDGGAELRTRAAAYDRFQDAFRRRLKEGNPALEAVAFNFGAGNYPAAKSYIDWFPLTLQSYVYLGFHEYGWPALSPEVIAGSASSAYTYHDIMIGLRKRYGKRHKAIITEAGLARMYKYPDDPAGDVGWLYEADAVSQEDYLRSLEWYNSKLCQDDFVVGACLFSVGPGGAQAKWRSFRHLGKDQRGRALQIIPHLQGLVEAGPAQPEQPAAPAVTTPSQPEKPTTPAVTQPPAPPQPSVTRTCRVGVHGRNDRLFGESDYQVIRDAKIETVKMMSLTDPAVFQRVRDENPDIQIITRLYGGGFGTGGHPSPQDFVQEMMPIIGNLRPHCTKFQIHNEPNHAARIEGWGKEPADAQSFNQWFLEVYGRLKAAFPWASFGFPGLALPDWAHNTRIWLGICKEAINKADWLGVHCYWQTPPGGPSGLMDPEFGLTFKYHHDMYPGKRVEILECGNSNIQRPPGQEWPISDEAIAAEYVRWLLELFKYDYVGSASFFILSSPDAANWGFFSWRTENSFKKPVVLRIRDMDRLPRRDVVALGPAQGPSVPGGWTNQQVITAFNKASLSLGLGNWKLMDLAGIKLGDLVKARSGPYSGLAIDQIPTLTAEQKALIQQQLAAQVAEAMPLLEAMVEGGGFLWQRDDLAQASLDLPRQQHLPGAAARTGAEKRVVTAWNRYGYLLLQIADILRLEPACAVAVVAALAGRRGLAADERLLIRFEPALFYEEWGKDHEAGFDRYFRLDPRRPASKQQWRPAAGETWRASHSNQADEWQAFGLASTLDEAAAKRSTRLGLALILGAEYAALGYESVGQMFDAFSSGERYQFLGVFDRIAGPRADPRLLDTLRAHDWTGFAALYFGKRQAARRGKQLHDLFDAFDRLKLGV